MRTNAESLDDWQAKGRRFALDNGERLFYRDAGNGEAVLCLHGFPTASWDWHRLWPDLVREFRVVAPDFLGYGFSDKPADADLGVLAQADRVEALLRSLAIERVHVLAHDVGDSVAQELLARRERRRAEGRDGLELRAVCYLNGGLFPEASHPRPIQRLLLTPLGPWIARHMTERRFARSFVPVFGTHTKPSARDLGDFWRLIRHDDGQRLAHRQIRYLPERRRQRARWLAAMREAAVPQRLIVGMSDPVSGADVARRYRELLPGADVVELAGIGHYPQLEAPQATLRAWREFVAIATG